MQFLADFHVHSHYSMATSRQCDPAHLCQWAAKKGLGLVGTGDFTHPAWRAELRDALVEAEHGLFRFRGEGGDGPNAGACRSVRFILTAEISSIYKRHGKTRKVHSVVIVPTFDAADRISVRLSQIGNISADGRPILGLDVHDLLEMCLTECPEVMFIPAHIWTPHFSLLGARSGFDTIEDCFDDLAEHITAMETGLSSDPPMNWRLSALDRYSLVSNSDAHSPANLARECNIFDCELDYRSIRDALTSRTGGFLGTVEFFPEEGKYHYDGHRNCGVRWDPAESEANGGMCPVCGKRVTEGVLHRVATLADRPPGVRPPAARHFERLVPLKSVVASAMGAGESTVAVERAYDALITSLGSELGILRDVPIDEIRAAGGELVAEGVRRVRAGQLSIEPGFDGEYGRVSIFTDAERHELAGQTRLFDVPEAAPKRRVSRKGSEEAAALEAPRLQELFSTADGVSSSVHAPQVLNREQLQAASLDKGTILVVAGPGTGKTRTLVHRIGELLRRGVAADSITAVTFTRKAAAEVAERVAEMSTRGGRSEKVRVGTFHSICMRILRSHPSTKDLVVLDESDRLLALSEAVGRSHGTLSDVSSQISLLKAHCIRAGEESVPVELSEVYKEYEEILLRWKCLDYDDIVLRTIDLWRGDPEVPRRFGAWFRHLLIDEFQDVNEAQYQLVREWSAESESLFVIGDPDQSIYEFRGSDPRYFRVLAAEAQQSHLVNLSESYRSQHLVARAANAVISHNDGERAPIRPVRSASAPILAIECKSDLSEAISVVRETERLVGGTHMLQANVRSFLGEDPGDSVTYGFSDIAVLYRTGRQAAILEECFAKAGIPYKVAGQKAVESDPEVDDVLALMKLALEPSTALRWLRCLRLPEYRLSREGLGEVSRTLYSSSSQLPEQIAHLPLSLSDREKIERLVTDLGVLLECQSLDSSRELVERCIAQMGRTRSAGLARLVAFADQCPSLSELHDHLLLGRDADWMRVGYGEPEAEHVSLMTIHAAKGLEFSVVFVVGCEEGFLPLTKVDGSANTVEEERRLFYVAMTRAKDRLYLTYVQGRQRAGREDAAPSRFISEIPEDCLQSVSILPGARSASRDRQVSLF